MHDETVGQAGGPGPCCPAPAEKPGPLSGWPVLKPLAPEPEIPWYTRLADAMIMYVTWPWYARQLRRAGFSRTGWMTWETGPGDD